MANRSLSWTWVLLSFLVYIALELLLGGVVLQLFTGRFVGEVTRIRIETLLIMTSFVSGGFLVGLASRRVRLLEPAIGAFLAVATTFVYALFTPVRFYGFFGRRVLFGGLLAFLLALGGAYLGEKVAARLGNTDSQTNLP